MARCGCSGTSCSCVVIGGTGVTVSGSGSSANPYVITGASAITASDTPTVDMTLTGNGAPATPYQLSAEATLDVDVSAQAVGRVLTVNGTNSGYIFAAAPTAAPGAISTENAMSGDGSVGAPLKIDLQSDSGLTNTSAGLKVNGAGGAQTYDPAWVGSTTNPAINDGTKLGRYIQFLNMCWVNIDLVVGAGTARGSGLWNFALPPGLLGVPGSQQTLTLSITVPAGHGYSGFATVGNQQNTLGLYISSATSASRVSAAVPNTFPAGSHLIITGIYEVDM